MLEINLKTKTKTEQYEEARHMLDMVDILAKLRLLPYSGATKARLDSGRIWVYMDE